MQSIFALLACLISITGLVNAQVSYQSRSICTTLYGTKSVVPKSTGYKVTIPVTVVKKVTSTPTRTITLPAASTVVTSTRTSATTVTITLSSTVTNTETAVLTATQTSTAVSTASTTVTTTATAPTSTVSAAPDFTPLANSPGYVAKRRSLDRAPFAVRGSSSQPRKRQVRYDVRLPSSGGSFRYTPARYQTSTICATVVQAITTSTKTFTASTTVTKTLPRGTSTTTTYASTTTTFTTVGAPSLSTLITTTTFETSTTVLAATTITTTETATQTVDQPGPTVYAQCQPNNVIGSANGGEGITGLAEGSDVETASVGRQADATACCIICAQTSRCAGYYFGVQNSICVIASIADPAACAGSNRFLSFGTDKDAPANSGVILGNGRCGGYANSGSNSN